MLGDPEAKDLTVGKSWGTRGSGTNNNLAAKADGTDVSMIAHGKTSSRMLAETDSISTTKC